MEVSVVAIDFETYLISATESIPRPVCLSWYDGTNKGLAVGKQEIDELLEKLFISKKKIVAHNATFENLVIYKHLAASRFLEPALNQNRVHCTLILISEEH